MLTFPDDRDNKLLRNVVLITGKSSLQSTTFHKNVATHCSGNGMFLLIQFKKLRFSHRQTVMLPIANNDCQPVQSVPTDRAKKGELCFILGTC
jgi:hypothetical protein